MLAKEPKRRPQTPGEVAEALVSYCRGHDLPALARQAATSEPRIDKAATSPSPTPWPTRPKGWMSRRVPVPVAIAAGLLGILVGLCLSILIIITNPDGTKSILRLADGSRVEIREEVQDSARTADGTSGQLQAPPQPDSPEPPDERAQLPPGQPIPLSFAVLVNRDSSNRTPSATEAEIVAATEQLQRNGRNGSPVITTVGTWYPLAEDTPVPVKSYNNGIAYALVSNSQRVGWSDISGNVETVIARSTQIEATLSDELAGKLTKLTSQNIRNQLAIVVNDQIRSAPYINSEIGKQVVITGVFQSGETKQLADWLAGGLVHPLPPIEVPRKR